MTDPFATCERWQEPISLLAAGCLPAEEEADVRQHLAHCAACAARAAELTAVCASLSRSRPSAAVHTAAVCERWNAAAEGVLPCRPVRHTPSLGFWLSGALAASLLIAAVWLVHRQPGGSPPGPQEPRVAAGGASPGQNSRRCRPTSRCQWRKCLSNGCGRSPRCGPMNWPWPSRTKPSKPCCSDMANPSCLNRMILSPC